MLFLNFLPFSLQINALAHSICTFLYLPNTNVKFKRKNTQRWHDKKFHLTSTENIHEHHCIPFTSLSWEGNMSFITASQDMKDLLGKAALDHTSSYLSLRHTCILFNSTMNCNSSFTASHTALDHLAVSILFLISLQVEIRVTFPYLNEIQYIELP